MQLIFELDAKEDKWWSDVIKEYRNKLVRHPSEYLKSYTTKNKTDLNALKKDVSGFIREVRECARLQGYPENFIIPVSDNQAYRQFGNSVAVPVIKAIAKQMLKYF